METSKNEYKMICETNNIPLFSMYYWMDAVCGDENWDVLLYHENGKAVAALPYYLNKTAYGIEIRKAALTQNNGIIFLCTKDTKYETKLSFECKVIDYFIDKLDTMGIYSYRQYFHYSFTNWLPFHWRGFQQSTRYTYIIENTSDLDTVYSDFSGNVRKNIRKAKKHVKIRTTTDYKTFYEMNKRTYERQNMSVPYTFDLFEKLYMNLKAHDSVEIMEAIDELGNIHAIALFGVDSDSVYYLMSGSDEQYRSSQSLTYLIYEGIKLAYRLKKKFDFEGSMKKNIERFFRQFGAKQFAYFDISKEYRKNV